MNHETSGSKKDKKKLGGSGENGHKRSTAEIEGKNGRRANSESAAAVAGPAATSDGKANRQSADMESEIESALSELRFEEIDASTERYCTVFVKISRA